MQKLIKEDIVKCIQGSECTLVSKHGKGAILIKQNEYIWFWSGTTNAMIINPSVVIQQSGREGEKLLQYNIKFHSKFYLANFHLK
jgi:hypothetical protein